MTKIREKRHAALKKEPWEQNEPPFNIMDYNSSMYKNLNYYNIEVDGKTKQSWCINYWKDQGKPTISFERINDGYFSTPGALVRLIEREVELTPKHLDYLSNRYNDILTKASNYLEEQKIQKAKTDEKPKIEDPLAKEYQTVISELNGAFDELIMGNDLTINIKSIISTSSLSRPWLHKLGSVFSNTLKEIQEAIAGKDPELTESYSCYTRRTLRQMTEFCQSIADLCNQVKNVVRKPTVRKAKPPAVIAAKVKYLKEFPEWKLKSLPAEKIIGCIELWVFNTKYRKMSRYVAVEGMSLTIKGTTLVNFDTEKSGSKTLRKPIEFFEGTDDATKRPITKKFNDINGVLAKVNGRINEETIIWKIFN